jgi:hypothetical protein
MLKIQLKSIYELIITIQNEELTHLPEKCEIGRIGVRGKIFTI